MEESVISWFVILFLSVFVMVWFFKKVIDDQENRK